MGNTAKELSFFDHLEELRGRVIKSILAIVVCACLFYFCVDQVLAMVIKPVGKLVFTSPPEVFLARMTITLLGGLFVALPFVLYQIWKFVVVGLRVQERKYVLFFVPFSFVFFILGGLFAYHIVIPIALQFLLSFSSDFIEPMITVEKYIAFVGTLVLAGGIVFELPIVLMFLTMAGIVTPDYLREKRRHAIVIILLLSAILTPPDVITQVLMAIPLMVLYEVSIVITQIVHRRQNH